MGRLSSIKYFLAALLFFGGMSLLLYPAIAGLINEQTQTAIVDAYEEDIDQLDENTKTQSVEQAKAYNESLVQSQEALVDPFAETTGENASTTSYLSVGDVMGSIEIPKIAVKLPIYEGSSEKVLQKGIGWLPGTSLPIGGESSHAVLTGHRGLPSAKLFSDLDKLEAGDEFYVQNVSGIIAYKVCSVQVIEPEDTSALGLVEGKDLLTLLTCHPYSINSHRLLVTGERIEYTGQLDQDAVSENILDNFTPVEKEFALAVSIAVGAAILFAFLIRGAWKNRRKRAKL